MNILNAGSIWAVNLFQTNQHEKNIRMRVNRIGLYFVNSLHTFSAGQLIKKYSHTKRSRATPATAGAERSGMGLTAAPRYRNGFFFAQERRRQT